MEIGKLIAVAAFTMVVLGVAFLMLKLDSAIGPSGESADDTESTDVVTGTTASATAARPARNHRRKRRH